MVVKTIEKGLVCANWTLTLKMSLKLNEKIVMHLMLRVTL